MKSINKLLSLGTLAFAFAVGTPLSFAADTSNCETKKVTINQDINQDDEETVEATRPKQPIIKGAETKT